MQKYILTPVLALLLSQAACSHSPVRHLTSDVCLMTKGTTRQDVVTYMGPPDQQMRDQFGEIWIYYQVNKSILRKTPFIGDNLGKEDVDVVTVRFDGDVVATCAYRSLTSEEFNKSGISTQYEDGAE